MKLLEKQRKTGQSHRAKGLASWFVGFDFFNTYLNSFVVVEEKNHYNSVLTYKTSSGSDETSLTCLYNNSKMIFLNSGTILYADIVNPSSDTQSFQRRCYVVDINGLKGPNQFGRDTFFLCLDGMHGAVVPHHSKDSEPAYVERTRDELKNGVSGNYSYQCNKTNGRGMWCAALIINDSWQIKNDYPW